MPSKPKSSKGSKAGRAKGKMSRYWGAKTREKHALKRVYHSQGIRAAKAYAEKHLLSAYLREHTYTDDKGVVRWGRRNPHDTTQRI